VLTLGEVLKAELLVAAGDVENSDRQFDPGGDSARGTQTKVAESDPGSEHRFKLEPGDYDAYVENRSGNGKPFATSAGIHLEIRCKGGTDGPAGTKK